MLILLSRWTEPCDGNDAQTVDLTPAETQRVQNVIDWLEEHARGNWGHTLCSWELLPTKTKGEADKTGVESVLNWIALNSRYNETGTPGDYYEGQTNPDLDGRPT